MIKAYTEEEIMMLASDACEGNYPALKKYRSLLADAVIRMDFKRLSYLADIYTQVEECYKDEDKKENKIGGKDNV